MFLLTGQQIDGMIAYQKTYFFAGLALMALPALLPRGFAFGLFTGFSLVGRGIYALSLRKWRTEPGLWMLAALLVVLLTTCYGYFSYLRFWNLFLQPPANGAKPAPNWISVSIDYAIAMTIFCKQVSLALAVFVQNRRLVRAR